MKLELTVTVTKTIEVEDDLDMVERMRSVTSEMEDIASDFEVDGWGTITDFNFSIVAGDDEPAATADEDDEDDEG